MSVLRNLQLRAYLLSAMGNMAFRLTTIIVLGQRALIVSLLLLASIALSALVSRAIVVDSALELAIHTPSPSVEKQLSRLSDVSENILLDRVGADMLWNHYGDEVVAQDHNRDILANLILLSSALGFEKDLAQYQRQFLQADPLLSCDFSDDAAGLLNIDCSPPLL
ncbi:hypothetical protein KA012_01480 [Candidatus Woesebacteria bacterium]|nr:hypothetical protein [Candidatus Woesebacteria bacterium]